MIRPPPFSKKPRDGPIYWYTNSSDNETKYWADRLAMMTRARKDYPFIPIWRGLSNRAVVTNDWEPRWEIAMNIYWVQIYN
jgi:hypothetical protein